jgi:predicted permease
MLPELLRRLRSLVRGGSEDAETEAELRFHLHMETEKNLAAGMTPLEARRQAHLRLGGTVSIREAVRDARGVRPLADAIRDIGLTIRSLRRSRLFTAVTVATLSLGIGATTAVYSFVDGILLSPLPYRQPDQLMTVQLLIPELDQFPFWNPNARSVDAWRRGCRTTCRELAALQPVGVVATGDGTPERLGGARVLPGFFELLRVEPLLGRVFRPADGETGSARVAVLTHGLWQRRYGGDPSVLGRIITLDDQPAEVIGVLPASFRFPRFSDPTSIGDRAGSPELFEPLAWTDSQIRSPGAFDFPALLRLSPDVTAAQATVELDGILDDAYAGAPVQPSAYVRPLADQVTRNAHGPLWLLLAAVAAVLVVACMNVSGLLAARGLDRRRDLALRRALGAPPRDALLRVLRESLLLALAGGLGGVAVAFGALRLLVAAAPADLPRLDEVSVDGAVLAASLGVTLACGLLCSLAPAWQAGGVDPMETLTVREAAARPRGAAPTLLVGLQAAVGVCLLVVTGLLLASFARVMQIDRGFDVERILAADVQLSRTRYPDPGDLPRTYSRVLSELESVPGVRAVGLVQRLPLEGNWFIDHLARADDARPTAEWTLANFRFVNPDYLQAMGIALTRGRMFTENDRQRPVVISEDTARTLWPGEDPIGRLVRRGEQDPREVVGVVASARIVDLEADSGFVAYAPYWEFPALQATLVVRTETDPTAMIASIAEAVRTVDPALPLYNVRTMDAILSNAVAGRRFQLALTVGFALAGLLLVGLGVYGVVAAAVARRRTEIAVRLALGATTRRVFGMALRIGLRPVIMGAAVGLAAAAAAGRTVAALLYEVAPHDWMVLSTSTLVVLGVAMAASLAPAARAVRTPTTTLLQSE